MSTSSTTLCLLYIASLLLLLERGPTQSTASRPHVISFRFPNLYPEGIAYDQVAQHFILGSFRDRILVAVSDAGVVETLIHDTSLPVNTTLCGLAVDPPSSHHRRVLAAVNSIPPLSPFTALAAYDLRTGRRLFLSLLPSPPDSPDRSFANAVSVDFEGNAYVTNSLGNSPSNGNYIWKVNAEGEASIWSKSPIFTRFPYDETTFYSNCGLNGIAYVSKGYLLVAQTNTGKLFKVDAEEGTAREVLLNKELRAADGVAVRGDGVVLVVSAKKMWFLKSQDSWGEAVVYDETDLDEKRFPTSVTVGREGRAYVIYGRMNEAILGNVVERERFEIEEVRSGTESQDENIWVYVLVGLGFAYLAFWRFQMKKLVANMDKKNT